MANFSANISGVELDKDNGKQRCKLAYNEGSATASQNFMN